MDRAASRTHKLVFRLPALLLALLAGMFLVNTAFSSDASAQNSNITTDPEFVAMGRDLFGLHCAVCHGETLRGLGKAPNLQQAGTAAIDFSIRTGRMPLEAIDSRVTRGPQQFTDVEREAIVAYTASVMTGGAEIPRVNPERGDLAHGRELFTNNCAACHGPTGAGIAVGQRDIAPNLSVATPLEIAEAIRSGPGRMPVFGDDSYSEEDVDSVVAWVLDLRQRAAPGGAQIGRSGPVFEGTVAWVLGLGLLFIAMYLLGAKGSGLDEPLEDGDVDVQ